MALVKSMLFLYLLLLLKAESKCPKSFDCGPHRALEFPFSNDPNCGLFVIKDCSSPFPAIDIRAEGYWYSFKEKKSANQLLLFDYRLETDLIGRNCSSFNNLTLPHSPSFSSTLITPYITLFKCSNQTLDEDIDDRFQGYQTVGCQTDPLITRPTVYYSYPNKEMSSVPSACSVIQLPVKSDRSSDDLFELISPEFILEWSLSEACSNCYREGGQCIDNGNKVHCKKGNMRSRKIFLLIGGVAALTSISIIVFLSIRRKYTLLKLLRYHKNSANDKDFEVFMKTNGNLAPRRYKYSQIKKMTNSFGVSLGKGGYGSVYRGNLPDGCPVPVKILEESKGSGDEFMNEVASISRTSHVNVVTLLGFCSEGSKRALIYEYMPNGSLEKFIQNTPSSVGLGWRKLSEIALGIARGLEYLHHSCNMRILHFDIKPHNILLDENFNPRISDFGLARLCPNRSSIVSMLVARGTIGYIAPEVFCRNFGEVSHKSDVYSYGMMVLEIAGGKKTVSPKEDRSSEMYFPHYIYKQLEADGREDGNLDEILREDESQFAKRKLVIVGLWCIQTDPKDRPSMTKVVEMLEGELELLQVPPKPYLSSPPRSAPEFSTSESM